MLTWPRLKFMEDSMLGCIGKEAWMKQEIVDRKTEERMKTGQNFRPPGTGILQTQIGSKKRRENLRIQANLQAFRC